MLAVSTEAPTFTAPVVGDDIGEIDLTDRLEEEAPIVLVFFPGPFTEVCTNELVTFRDGLEAFEAVDATVYGVHTDTPGSLQAFRERHDFDFGLISDTSREIVEAYDVRADFDAFGVYDVPDRAVYIIDADGRIAYAWVADDPATEPDYDVLQNAVQDAAEA
ncbi:peroxiredoxin [Halobacteriales archaeon QH_10_65_19]|nr:MAG: peroxiredoxin [Halobacteriales archaeon QH_10_65_19]